MIRQTIQIERLGWKIHIYYGVDKSFTEDIIDEMIALECNMRLLEKAWNNLSSGELNTGLTYTNVDQHSSLVVISQTTSPANFLNTLIHEVMHVVQHICGKIDIDIYSEEACYLGGDISQAMYEVASVFLCECECCENRKTKMLR